MIRTGPTTARSSLACSTLRGRYRSQRPDAVGPEIAVDGASRVVDIDRLTGTDAAGAHVEAKGETYAIDYIVVNAAGFYGANLGDGGVGAGSRCSSTSTSSRAPCRPGREHRDLPARPFEIMFYLRRERPFAVRQLRPRGLHGVGAGAPDVFDVPLFDDEGIAETPNWDGTRPAVGRGRYRRVRQRSHHPHRT